MVRKNCALGWKQVANNSYTWRSNGFCTDCLAILLLAVATLEADGLLMCIGYCLTLVNTIFFGFIGYALWQARDLLPNLFS